MRTLITFLFLTTIFLSETFAQAIEFSGYGGYMVSGKSTYYDGRIDVYDGGVFGATLGYDMGNGIQVQFLYNRNNASGRIDYYRPVITETYNFDLVLEHYHLGAEKTLGGNEWSNLMGHLAWESPPIHPKIWSHPAMN